MSTLGWVGLAPLGMLALFPARVLAHGGVGVPVLGPLSPGAGEIQDPVGASVNLHWEDFDPDDNAHLAIMVTADLANPSATLPLVSGLEEDCDPTDSGPIFTGVLDAGPGGTLPSQEVQNESYCRRTSGGCTYESDCYSWDVTAVPPGVYHVLGALDDNYPDGGGGSLSFRASKGVVRITAAGHNVQPVLLFTQPDGVGDLASGCFRVQWVDSDPDDNARIALWIAPAFGNETPILMAQDIPEDDLANGFDVDLSGAEFSRDYVITAEISDGVNPPWRINTEGYITRYARRVDGGLVPLDGGCLGPPPAWPPGSVWPTRDAGSSAGDAATRDSAVALEDASGGEDAALEPAPQSKSTCLDNSAVGGLRFPGLARAAAWLVLLGAMRRPRVRL